MVIKTEKELLRLIWKEMGLRGHNADIKKKAVIVKEVHKAVEFGLKDLRQKRMKKCLMQLRNYSYHVLAA